MKTGRTIVLSLFCCIFLVSSVVADLSNNQKLDLLEERFLKGEVSEKIYLELREKYVVEKPPTVNKTARAKDGNFIQNADFQLDKDKNQIPDGWFSKNRRYLPKDIQGKPILNIQEDIGTYRWEDKGYLGGRSILVEAGKGKGWGGWCTKLEGIKPNTNNTLSLWYKQPYFDTLEVMIFGQELKVRDFLISEPWMRFQKTVNSGQFSGNCNLAFLTKKSGKKVCLSRVGLYEDSIIEGPYGGGYRLGRNQATLEYYAYEKGYISPDVPSIVSMGLRYQFLDKQPESLRIVLELPQEIKLAGYYVSIPGKSTQLKKEEKKRNNHLYTKYTILYPVAEQRYVPHYSSGNRDIHWYLTTTSKKDELKAYYSMKWEGGRQPEQELPLEIVPIPQTTAPKKLITHLSAWPGVFEHCPGYAQSLKHLGINRIGLPFYLGRYIEKKPKGYLKGLITELHEQGIEVVDFLINIHRFYWYSREARVTDIQGNKPDIVPRSGSLCLSKISSGEGFQKTLTWLKSLIDIGVDGVYFDDEWNQPCFCNLCKEQFKTFLKDYAPELKYVDPGVFEKDSKNYEELHQAWIAFGKWYYVRGILALRQELEKYLATGDTPKRKFEMATEAQCIGGGYKANRQTSYIAKAYTEAFDYYGEQIYINCYVEDFRGSPRRGGDRAALINTAYRSSGVKQLPVVGAGLIYMDPMYAFHPHKIMKYLLLEVLAAGGAGFQLYYPGDPDVLHYKYVADVVRMILPVEDIILEGELIGETELLCNAGNLRGLKHKQGSLILVSDYSTFENVPVEIVVYYEVKEKLDVVDLETKEVIGQLSSEKQTFKVRLGKERARLFYVGKRDNIKCGKIEIGKKEV